MVDVGKLCRIFKCVSCSGLRPMKLKHVKFHFVIIILPPICLQDYTFIP